MTYSAPNFQRRVFCLLGLPFDAVDLPMTVARIRSAAAGGAPCFLSTPNLNFLISCREDAGFRASVINSDLSIADGMPLVWMARLLGLPIRERVAGSSVFEALRSDAQRPLSVYFFGGPPGVAERAAARLNAEAKGLRCAGFECPGFGSIEDMSSADTIERINTSGADFVVVALGARKGQAWIEHNRGRLSAPVISHLGAVVNFVAGTVSRAPAWMQKFGLEWLWRIKEEPELWRRYLGDGVALVRLLVTRVLPLALLVRRRVRANPEEPSLAAGTFPDGSTVLRLGGAWTVENLEPLRVAFTDLVRTGSGIRLDLSRVTFVDSAMIGLLMLLHGHATGAALRCTIAGATGPVRRLFELHCAAFLLTPLSPEQAPVGGFNSRCELNSESRTPP